MTTEDLPTTDRPSTFYAINGFNGVLESYGKVEGG